MGTTEKKVWIYGGIGAVAVWLLFLRGKEFGGDGIDPTGNTGNTGNGGYSFDAHKVATDLYEAMRYMGTDEDAVLSILTPVSQPQFGQVVTAFGSLPYNPTTGNQSFLLWETVTKYDLKGWLKEELSSTDYANLKRKYPNYL